MARNRRIEKVVSTILFWWNERERGANGFRMFFSHRSGRMESVGNVRMEWRDDEDDDDVPSGKGSRGWVNDFLKVPRRPAQGPSGGVLSLFHQEDETKAVYIVLC